MGEVLRRPVLIAPVEAEDFDFVASWIDDEATQHICRSQLKEVAPPHRNRDASLEEVIGGLTRYADTSDLTVAIKFNRVERFEPADVKILDGLSLGALWIFAALTADQSKFALWGDFAHPDGEVVGHVFDYPTEASL
jgi:hypothetical protein